MSLLLWFPLNGDLTNNGIHKINMNNNNKVTINDTGKIGDKCYFLSDTALAAKGFTALNNTSEYSACCWVKFSSFPASGQAYCMSVNTTTSTDYKFIIGIVSSNGTTAKMRVNASSKTDTGTLQLNTWYHLAFCVSGTIGYMYLNGELIKTVSGLSQTPASNFVIGGRSSNSGATSFNGTGAPAYYNDVRVYDHCLSPREVKQLSRGLVMHYKLDNGNNTNLITKSYNFNGAANVSIDPVYGWNVLSGDNTSGTSYKELYVNNNIVNVKYGDIYTASFYAKSSTSTGLTTYFYNNVDGVSISNILSSEGTTGSSSDGNCRFLLTPQWKKYWVRYTFKGSRGGSTAALNKHLLFRMLAGDKVDIAGVKLERGPYPSGYGLKPSEIPTPLVEKDVSGFGHHGTRSTEMTYTSDSKRYGSATNFTGANYIHGTGFSTEGQPDLTMCAWVYPENISNGTDINCICIGGAYLAIRAANACVTTYCYGKNPAGYHTAPTSSALPMNQWSHIAAVWDGVNGNHKIYVNGSEVFTVACTGVSSGGAQDKKDIGLENGSLRPFIGKISDVRIYTTPLSASDIKEVYVSTTSFHENNIVQCHNLVEAIAPLKFKENGLLQTNDMDEIGYIGGMKTKVLSDGSAWARIHWLDVTNEQTWFTKDEVQFCNASNRFSRMGLVDHFKSNKLPKGYQKLNYIESTGSQYIDTGYYWTSENVQIVMDAYITSNASNQSLFGNEEYYDGSSRYFSIIPHGANGSFNLYTGTGAISSVAPGLTTRFTLDCSTGSNKLTVKLNGTQVSQTTYSGTIKTYANSTSTNASKGKIYIFSNHNSGNDGANPTQHIGGMRLYNFKMYDNGKIVRDFVPCKNSSGTVGLFDMVYQAFYSSPNGTAFTASLGSVENSSGEGVYEFMLTHPRISSTLYNRWIQSSSPNATSVTGFKNITQAWSQANAGIRKNGSSCVYNCDSGSTWYAPIGQTTGWSSGGKTNQIPAANETPTTEIELWVRIDNLNDIKKISMLDNGSIQAFNIKEI